MLRGGYRWTRSEDGLAVFERKPASGGESHQTVMYEYKVFPHDAVTNFFAFKNDPGTHPPQDAISLAILNALQECFVWSRSDGGVAIFERCLDAEGKVVV